MHDQQLTYAKYTIEFENFNITLNLKKEFMTMYLFSKVLSCDTDFIIRLNGFYT